MLYDISPPISPDLPVWPGDAPPRRDVTRDERSDHTITGSVLHMSAHTGAHADAPLHMVAAGRSIDAMELERYIGPCEVVAADVRPRTAIEPDDLPLTFHAPRVLLKTGSYRGPETFNRDFAGLSPAAADHLVSHGVLLIGLDTPSIDPFGSESHPAHQRLLGAGVAVLEGLLLREVPPGMYELIAPPLRIVGGDGSPVRAVLRA